MGREGEKCGVVLKGISSVSSVIGVKGVRGVCGGNGVVIRVLLVMEARWIVGRSKGGEISKLVSAGER